MKGIGFLEYVAIAATALLVGVAMWMVTVLTMQIP